MSHGPRGIVLAGGTGSRLYPLTQVTNKHLLPVGREPMILHPIRRLLEAGVHQIMVITSRDHAGDIARLLGSGDELGAEFTFRVQDSAGGVAHGLGLCRSFAGESRVVVMLGDNIFGASIRGTIERFIGQPSGARVVLARAPDPQHFGVAVLDPAGEGKLIRIEEKPAHPASAYVVTGLYCYDSWVFELLADLVPSARGELEITDVNNAYLARGELQYDLWQDAWTDAGTFAALQRANILVSEGEPR